MLARRDYCHQELILKLQKKGYCLEDIERVTASLVEAGLINDNRFAESYVNARRHKGYGPKRIALELKTHGLADEIIAEHINITDNVWLDDAHDIWRRRFKGKIPKEFAERTKQMRFLQYRGFTHEQIGHVIKAIKDDVLGDESLVSLVDETGETNLEL